MSLEFFLDKYLEKIHKGEYGNLGLLSNQCSYSFREQAYFFQILEKTQKLRCLFIPEHGLFAELQDQEPMSNVHIYDSEWLQQAKSYSLYQDNEQSLYAPLEALSQIQTLVVDIQDVGSRYYTFATTLSYIFSQLCEHTLPIDVLVIERPNPAGRFVEGTLLTEEHQSFVGYPGLPHRHGLSIGELALFYQRQKPSLYTVEVIWDQHIDYFPDPFANSSKATGQRKAQNEEAPQSWSQLPISPSPNISNPITPLLYSGQCLWEGTNISEGRGTTHPFEIFGAPFLSKQTTKRAQDWTLAPRQSGAILRPLRFMPTFHKFAKQICDGFQIHLDLSQAYHSLAHSLKLIAWLRTFAADDFAWRDGIYEFCSEKKAIEILAGDPLLWAYLNASASFSAVRKRLIEQEEQWIRNQSPFNLHPEPLRRIDLLENEDFDP